MSEMKCSVEGCNAERFYSKGHLSTCMGVENYIDAKGNRHWHDPNSHAEQFVCSNGHHFGISQPSFCPIEGCSFGKSSRLPGQP